MNRQNKKAAVQPPFILLPPLDASMLGPTSLLHLKWCRATSLLASLPCHELYDIPRQNQEKSENFAEKTSRDFIKNHKFQLLSKNMGFSIL